MAQALGGINPFDPQIGRLNRHQIELILHWRFPPEAEENKDAQFKENAEQQNLVDEAMFGKPQKSQDEQLAAQYTGFDYLVTDNEPV